MPITTTWDPEWPGQVKGRPGTLTHFKRWAEQLVFDDGEHHEVEDWQADVMKDLFKGFIEVWLLVPQGNSKTTFVAEICLYHLETVIEPWVPVGASSRDQAEILHGQASGFVRRTPGLRFDKDENPHGPYQLAGRRTIMHTFNGGQGMKVYAADKETADGVIPTLFVVDEGHRLRDLSLYRTWHGKLRKRSGQGLMISTAGEPGKDFEKTRAAMRNSATDRKRKGKCYGRFATRTDAVLHEYAVPHPKYARDIRIVREANPLSKITEHELNTFLNSPTLDYGEDWLRLTCNIPARSSKAAVSELDWDRAFHDGEIPEGEPVGVGADFAWVHDTTALVPLWMPEKEFRLLGDPKVLEPPHEGMLDPLEVREAFLAINERNPIKLIVADKTKAEDTLMWAEEEFGCDVLDWSQGNLQAALDYERFMEGLRGGAPPDEEVREAWLRHTGDPILREHVMNAIARKLTGDRYMFDRPSPSRAEAKQDFRVIDGLKAASMIHSAVVEDLLAPVTEPMVAAGTAAYRTGRQVQQETETAVAVKMLAKRDFSITSWDGGDEIHVKRGDEYADDHEFVQRKPTFFEEAT